MKVICERCGCFSTDMNICSSCGARIELEDVEQSSAQTSENWGWADISIASVPQYERSKAVDALHKEWSSVENLTSLRLLKSQAEVFSFNTSTATVLVRRDILKSLVEHAQREVASISVAFTPLNESIETAEDANKVLIARKEHG